jgi:hypothetical protein
MGSQKRVGAEGIFLPGKEVKVTEITRQIRNY